jgi:hypothetical protein
VNRVAKFVSVSFSHATPSKPSPRGRKGEVKKSLALFSEAQINHANGNSTSNAAKHNAM